MKQLLPPVPFNSQVTGDGGMLSVPWTGFFKQLSKGWLNLRGTDSNDSADAGYVGEYQSALSAGVAVAATGTYVAIASLSLTAGDWDVEANAQVNAGSLTTVSQLVVGLSTAPTSIDSITSGGVMADPSAANTRFIPTGQRRFSLSETTTIYLVGGAFYAGGSATWSASSSIRARRVR